MNRKSKERFPLGFFMSLLASVLFFFALQLQFTILPLYAHQVGAGDSGWGLAFSVTAWAAVALRLLGGPLADRIGRKAVMIVGGLAMFLGCLVFFLVPNFTGLLVGRIIHGIAIGFFTTSYKALVIDLAPLPRRGEAVGIGNMTYGFAMISAPSIGEYIQASHGYQAVFLASAAFGLACTLVVLVNRAPILEPPRQSLIAGMGAVLRLRSQWAGIVGMFGVAASFAATVTFLPLLAGSKGLTGVGLAFSVYALAEFLGQPLGGRVGDRVEKRLIIVPGLIVLALGIIAVLLADSRWLLYVGTGLIGLSVAMTRVNLDTLVMGGAPVDLRGTAAALQYGSSDIWLGLAGWLLGILAESTGYATIYIILGMIPVIIAVLMWFMVPRRQIGERSQTAAPAAALER